MSHRMRDSALLAAAPPWLPKRAAATPDALAIEWSGGRLCYAELEQRAAAAARALAERGVSAGQRVAVRMPGGVGFAVLAHALQRLGVALVPLNLRLSAAERAYQVEDCGAHWSIEAPEPAEAQTFAGSARSSGSAEDARQAGRAAFARASDEARAAGRSVPSLASTRSAVPGGPCELAVHERRGAWLDFEALAAADPAHAEDTHSANPAQAGDPANAASPAQTRAPSSVPTPTAALDPEAPLALLYTSGTTGHPKGALLSHRAFAASAAGHAALLGLDARDRWLACMPLFHVGGLSILWRSTLAGSAVVLHERFEAERVARALDEDSITLVSLVPTMLARVLDVWGERRASRTLRCALIGGAGASEALLERARGAGFPIAPTYGMTEAASQVATRPPEDRAPPHGARLRPLPGTELRIESDEGRVLAAGEAGTIALRGPTLMHGYSGRGAAGASGIADDGWFRSGDIGVLDAEGRLQVLDRRRDLIVSGGENVYPAEIEAVLQDHPELLDAAVSSVPDDEYGARPVAWIVPRSRTQPPDSTALRAWCAERLARFKLPVAFRVVCEIPRNAAGKIARTKLGAGDD